MNHRPSVSPIIVVVLTGSLFLLARPLPAADTVAPATNAPSAAAPPDLGPGQTPAPDATLPSTTEMPGTYTVKSGDSLWDIAHKYHTSIAKIKKSNKLKSDHLKPGQVLKIPAPKTAPAATQPVKTTGLLKKSRKQQASDDISYHSARRAEPVQDFDLPASTFASCPVPVPAWDADQPTPAAVPAPIAETVPTPSPEMVETAPANPEAAPAESIPTPLPPASHRSQTVGTDEYSFSVPPSQPPPAAMTPSPSSPHRGLFSFFYTPPPAPDWGARFTQVARDLGNRNLGYDDDWCPPGEAHSWTMDCSNTTRYLYKVTTGIQLPRTASDQYYYLHLQNKAWDVPQTASGFADCNYLRQNLKPGDLLFWENTYRPERQPPITHVMVYLGTNARGQWTMAGSQTSRGGEHNRSHGGPDIYVFDPTKPCGGYSTWMGLVHHQGRFCAYGRPLEADKAKLAVAAND